MADHADSCGSCSAQRDTEAQTRPVCLGAGNVDQGHAADSVREIEYRGDPALPWEKRSLCDGCIADVRHAGLQIKGERPITSAQSQAYIDGCYEVPVSDEADQLIRDVVDGAFVCGEWTKDDDVSYAYVSAVHEGQVEKLRTYIADLESRVLSDATGVRS